MIWGEKKEMPEWKTMSWLEVFVYIIMKVMIVIADRRVDWVYVSCNDLRKKGWLRFDSANESVDISVSGSS